MVCYTDMLFFLRVQLLIRDTSDSPSQILKIVVFNLPCYINESKCKFIRVCLNEKIMKLILAGGFLQIILANAWQINDSDQILKSEC